MTIDDEVAILREKLDALTATQSQTTRILRDMMVGTEELYLDQTDFQQAIEQLGVAVENLHSHLHMNHLGAEILPENSVANQKPAAAFPHSVPAVATHLSRMSTSAGVGLRSLIMAAILLPPLIAGGWKIAEQWRGAMSPHEGDVNVVSAERLPLLANSSEPANNQP